MPWYSVDKNHAVGSAKGRNSNVSSFRLRNGYSMRMWGQSMPDSSFRTFSCNKQACEGRKIEVEGMFCLLLCVLFF